MNLLFFDTETTGFANGSRIIELGWILSDHDGQILSKNNYLIKPAGWIMPTAKFWTDNNFTHETSLAKGHPIAYVLDFFYADMIAADVLIAHNLSYDKRILIPELQRVGRQPITTGLAEFCTMAGTVAIAKVPNKDGKRGYKKPTLAELYLSLFQREMENNHSADGDVLALYECFFAMLSRKHIQLGLNCIL